MSGRRRKSRSRSKRAVSKTSSQGTTATVVSLAVVNVDLEDGEDKDKLSRSKQQTIKLAKSACRGAADERSVVTSASKTKHLTLTLRSDGTDEQQTEGIPEENVKTSDTYERRQRSAISKLDEVLDTPSQPRSELFSGSVSQIGPGSSDLKDDEVDMDSERSTKRSSRARKSRGSRSRTERKSGPRSYGSRISRHRRKSLPSRRRESKQLRSRKSGSKTSKAGKSKKEKEQFMELLECLQPECTMCKKLRKELNIEEVPTCKGDCVAGLKKAAMKEKLMKFSRREKSDKYRTEPSKKESTGAKFCTCEECCRYRQQGEIIPISRYSTQKDSSSKKQQRSKVISSLQPSKKTPQSIPKLKSPRKGASKKKSIEVRKVATSLHSTFPIQLRDTSSTSPYKTPQKRRAIPIEMTTPTWTKGTQYFTPEPQQMTQTTSSVRTAVLDRSTRSTSSRIRSRSPSSTRPPKTPMVTTGAAPLIAPTPVLPAAAITNKTLSQTSGGSSPAPATAISQNVPAPPAVETSPYIPERDYNPICNCTNCRKERRIREQNDFCDCYDCIEEMRSISRSADKSNSKSRKSSPHPPRRMKAEYDWVKKLLKIQQPGGRYHTPKEKHVIYPWQIDSDKTQTGSSYMSGSGALRKRSSSSHHGISIPSASLNSRPSSVSSIGFSRTTTQTETSSVQGSVISQRKSEIPSTSSTGTSSHKSVQISEFTPKKSNRRRRSHRNSHSARRTPSISDESDEDSWTEPDETSGSSYKTPRSRSRSQRRSKKKSRRSRR